MSRCPTAIKTTGDRPNTPVSASEGTVALQCAAIGGKISGEERILTAERVVARG